MVEGQQAVTNVIDTSELLRRLLDNEYIPEELRAQFWALWSNSLKLTYLEREDIDWYHSKFKIIRKLLLQQVTDTEFEPQMRIYLSQLELEYKSNLHRAWRGFERVTEATQINVNTDHANTVPKPDNMGFLARITKAVGL